MIKGNLTRVGTGVYELSISGFIGPGSVNALVAKNGFTIIPSNRDVDFYWTGTVEVPLDVYGGIPVAMQDVLKIKTDTVGLGAASAHIGIVPEVTGRFDILSAD